MDPDRPIDEQAEFLPYDQMWEFPPEKLKLGINVHYFLIFTN